MTENHQPNMLEFDQIKQFNRAGADRFGVWVATVVLHISGKVLAESYRVNINKIVPVLGSRTNTD